MPRSSRLALFLIAVPSVLFFLLLTGPRNLKERERIYSSFEDSLYGNASRSDNSAGVTGYLTERSPLSKHAGSSKEDSFCYNFLDATLHNSLPVCVNPLGSELEAASVSCASDKNSNTVIACILRNVIVHPDMLAASLLRPEHVVFSRTNMTIALLNNQSTTCDEVNLRSWPSHLKSSDYMSKTVEALKFSQKLSSNICQKWIEEDVYIFTAKQSQIYFRFLDYYNLHKLIVDFGSSYNTSKTSFRVIRTSGSNHYYFPKFDQKLFPEAVVERIDNLRSISTCFKKIILVPRAYSSPFFQCKMSKHLLEKCLRCDGSVNRNSPISTFRTRVLHACNLRDDHALKKSRFNITLISRNPYSRFPTDKMGSFQRILANEGALLLRLKARFKFANVHKVRLETLDICEQIRLVHTSDVLLGVHGAGLVHLWWLQEKSLVYELEPHFEVSNPTFRVLARLSGRRYMRSLAGGDSRFVYARINSVLSDIDVYLKSRIR